MIYNFESHLCLLPVVSLQLVTVKKFKITVRWSVVRMIADPCVYGQTSR